MCCRSHFAQPGGLVPGEEYLDGNALAVPDAAPHLPVATLADALAQRDLLGEHALDKKGQAGARGHPQVEYFAERGIVGCLGPQTDQLVLGKMTVRNKKFRYRYLPYVSLGNRSERDTVLWYRYNTGTYNIGRGPDS